MSAKPRSPHSTKVFIGAVVLAGGVALLHSLVRIYQEPPSGGWLILAALTLLSGLFTIKVPSIPARMSVSETFVFISVLLYGTPAATVTVALEALVMTLWRHRREYEKVLFNVTEPTLSIWVAAQLFALALGQSVAAPRHDLPDLFWPVGILCFTYFFLNSSLTAVAVGFETKSPVLHIWHKHFVWLFLNYLAAASVAVLIISTSATVGMTTLGIILPLLVVSYLTMKSSMGRVEDANKHVAQVDKLYLSTIESLAMAVDAKDQVTHGHIRRVQNLAVGMAGAIGLKDPAVLKAIEASALLHDMGKLAIPEYILNKPGKLSVAEFDKMKLHASIGADILSSIDFPYPVVPIVRHHHENWDGSGYPDGLSGANIPIGARILSVVDCFDALTSDRPYRRRMSDEEAIRILTERRGVMYDPLMVDTFLNVYREIRAEGLGSTERPALVQIIRSSQFLEEPISDGAGTAVRELTETVSIRERESEETFWTKVCRCFSDSCPVLYIFDASKNELVAQRIGGSYGHRIVRHRIPVGQGLSGWVAANRQGIMNSDAALDLGYSIPELVGNCSMSLPVLDGRGGLFAVVTVYGGLPAVRFSDRDKAILEALVPGVYAASETSDKSDDFARTGRGLTGRSRPA